MSISIVAEIGSNHIGSLSCALAHIVEAARCGATACKFQLFRAETLDAREEKRAQLRKYELPLDWIPILRERAHEQKVEFGVSVFAPDLVPLLRGKVDFIKVSAYDLCYRDLIQAVATLDVPIVFSTAMATYEEIGQVLQWIGAVSQKVTLLHGVAQYPATIEEQNLLALPYMGVYFADLVGLSDHTLGYEAAMMAVVVGASMIEKHFVIDPVVNPLVIHSPDYPHSADPGTFALMVEMIRKAERARGTGQKNGPLPCEMELYRTARRTNAKSLRGE